MGQQENKITGQGNNGTKTKVKQDNKIWGNGKPGQSDNSDISTAGQRNNETKRQIRINSQSSEDTQVGYISQKYSFDKFTLGRAFKPSHTFFSI